MVAGVLEDGLVVEHLDVPEEARLAQPVQLSAELGARHVTALGDDVPVNDLADADTPLREERLAGVTQGVVNEADVAPPGVGEGTLVLGDGLLLALFLVGGAPGHANLGGKQNVVDRLVDGTAGGGRHEGRDDRAHLLRDDGVVKLEVVVLPVLLNLQAELGVVTLQLAQSA